MKFSKNDLGLILRVILLVITLLAFAFTVLQKQYVYDMVLVPVILVQVKSMQMFTRELTREISGNIPRR